SGFYNLTRQLGGSVGVALLTTALDKRSAFHYAVLSEKLVANDPRTLERVQLFTQAMIARGADLVDAKQRALRLITGSLRVQASVMSFADTFWMTGALVLVAMPLIFLLGKPQQGKSVTADH